MFNVSNVGKGIKGFIYIFFMVVFQTATPTPTTILNTNNLWVSSNLSMSYLFVLHKSIKNCK